MSRLIRLSCLVALIFTFAPAPAALAEASELSTAPLSNLAQDAEISAIEKAEKAADDFLGGINQKLKIRFSRVGVKTVMVRFANLEFA